MTTQLDLLERDWVERMKPVVLAKMRGREFCSDDVHAIIEEPENRNLLGILFAALRKHLEPVGYVVSKRPEANGRPVRLGRCKE